MAVQSSTLNEHGVTSTYEEVLCFRMAVAKFMSDNQSDYHKETHNQSDYHKETQLEHWIGPIFSWTDNYDLNIATPNGTRNTHTKSCSSSSILPVENIGVMQLKIPQLTKCKSLQIIHQALQLEHYTSLSELNSPLLPIKSLSDEECSYSLLQLVQSTA